MSKAGKKLIKAMKEALEVARGERSDFRVTPSSGCIFCDIGLEPIKMKRQYVHYISKQGKLVVCPLKGINSMGDPSKRGAVNTDPEA